MKINTLIEVYQKLDYIPVVSTVTNAVTLVAKAALAAYDHFNPKASATFSKETHPIRAFLVDREWSRSVWLLIPVVGQIIAAIFLDPKHRQRVIEDVKARVLSDDPDLSRPTDKELDLVISHFLRQLNRQDVFDTTQDRELYNKVFRLLSPESQQKFFEKAIRDESIERALHYLDKEEIEELHISFANLLPCIRGDTISSRPHLQQKIENGTKALANQLSQFTSLKKLALYYGDTNCGKNLFGKDLNISLIREWYCSGNATLAIVNRLIFDALRHLFPITENWQDGEAQAGVELQFHGADQSWALVDGRTATIKTQPVPRVLTIPLAPPGTNPLWNGIS